MRNALLEAYKTRLSDFEKITSLFQGDNLSGPFLISPSEKYFTQPNPLLIIGQETFGWESAFGDLVKQMQIYENFNVGANYYASPFWNITRKVEKALGNLPYSCMWTNISKFDVNRKRAYGKHEREISTLDNLLIEEVKILQPKICLFYTGPAFDSRITKTFNQVKFLSVPGFSKRQFSQLVHPFLPALTFRSYHPNYLRRKGLESDFIEFIGSLSLEIHK